MTSMNRDALRPPSRHLLSLPPETPPSYCLPLESNGENAPFALIAGKKMFLESCSCHLIVSSFSTEKSKTWNPHSSFLLQFFPWQKPAKHCSAYIFFIYTHTHTSAAASEICHDLMQWGWQVARARHNPRPPEQCLQRNTWGQSHWRFAPARNTSAVLQQVGILQPGRGSATTSQEVIPVTDKKKIGTRNLV